MGSLYSNRHLDFSPSKTGTNTIDNTAFNLLDKAGDILLHISFRRPENAIVFNTCPKNGGWGKEERVTLSGTFIGADTTVTVYDHGNRYQILIDYHTVHYYEKRINQPTSCVSYTINENQTPPFSNPIAVSTYSSLAKIMARDD
jgi:hypothetical protein